MVGWTRHSLLELKVLVSNVFMELDGEISWASTHSLFLTRLHSMILVLRVDRKWVLSVRSLSHYIWNRIPFCH